MVTAVRWGNGEIYRYTTVRSSSDDDEDDKDDDDVGKVGDI